MSFVCVWNETCQLHINFLYSALISIHQKEMSIEHVQMKYEYENKNFEHIIISFCLWTTETEL